MPMSDTKYGGPMEMYLLHAVFAVLPSGPTRVGGKGLFCKRFGHSEIGEVEGKVQAKTSSPNGQHCLGWVAGYRARQDLSQGEGPDTLGSRLKWGQIRSRIYSDDPPKLTAFGGRLSFLVESSRNETLEALEGFKALRG